MNLDEFTSRMELNEQEQLGLAAGYLNLMNADLEVACNRERAATRDAFREQLRDGPLGLRAAASAPLPVENRVAFADLLAESADTARCLSVLVELCFCEPFGESGRQVDAGARVSYLGAVGIAMEGRVDEDDPEYIDEHLAEALEASKSNALKWVLFGLGGAVGVATAGVAAPAIGLAIGGAMGLSGAAAASAGLAALGGGSLEVGGFGMAGGTAVIGLAGGAVGATLGAAGSRALRGGRVQAEAFKLFALVRSFQRYVDEDPAGDESWELLALAGTEALVALADDLEAANGGDREENGDELDRAAKTATRLARRLEG